MQIRELEDNELNKISGGGITSSIMNAIISAVNFIYEVGKELGSTIRRMNEDSYCNVK